MAEKNNKEKTIFEEITLSDFYFPSYDITIKASSLEEAQEKLKELYNLNNQ